MAIVNAWLALRDDAQSAIVTRLNWDEAAQGPYAGPVTNRQARVFGAMSDRSVVQRLFRVDTNAGRDWTLWSVYFDEPQNVLQKLADELGQLATDYPSQFVIVGAWHWDGRQIGTQWNEDQTATTGTPTYPLHPRAIELMPDVDDIGTRPTEVSDVNLLFGQAPRRLA